MINSALHEAKKEINNCVRTHTQFLKASSGLLGIMKCDMRVKAKEKKGKCIAGFPTWVAPRSCLLLFSHFQLYIHLPRPVTTFKENYLKKQTSLDMNHRNIFEPQFYAL